MDALLEALRQFGPPVQELLSALFGLLLPWTPLVIWIVFWLYAVNWVKLRTILASGGWIGLVLIGAIMVLIWGSVAPIPVGARDFFDLKISNFVEKTVYVTGLFCIMLLAGSLQLSGFCGECCRFEEDEPSDSHGHDAHGHGDSHGHDHAPAPSHGHSH